jgi:hypothetical protein
MQEPETITYTIPAGGHYSEGDYFSIFSGDELKISFSFDESAVYDFGDENPNQADINKLFGFAEGSPINTHEHSANLGWRWYNHELQIFVYTYTGGRIKSSLSGIAELDKVYTAKITSTEEAYIFELDGSIFRLEKETPYYEETKYMLFPYFGIDETAPHEIRITITRINQ